MKRQVLLSIFFFCCASLLSAAGPSDPAKNNQTTAEFNCDLPAPAALTITDVTSTSAKGTWSAVSGAIGYNVEVRLASTNAIEYTNFTTSTFDVAVGLDPSAEHIMEVRSVCSNQQGGIEAASANFTTDIVIDLLVVNYQAPCRNTDEVNNIYYNSQPLPSSIQYTIDINQEYWLEVKQERGGQAAIARYIVNYYQIPGALVPFIAEVKPMDVNPDGEPLLGVTQGWDEFPYGNHIYYGLANVSNDMYGEHLVQINLSGNNEFLSDYALLRIEATGIGWAQDGRYQIKFVRQCGGQEGGSGKDRGDEFAGNSPVAGMPEVAVLPNPFNGLIYVMNQGETAFENCSIELTDLTGKVLIARNNIHLDAQQMLNLETTSLSAGMYLVKIKSGTSIRTIKMVKGE